MPHTVNGQRQSGVEHSRMPMLSNLGPTRITIWNLSIFHLSHALLKRPMICIFWCNLLLLCLVQVFVVATWNAALHLWSLPGISPEFRSYLSRQAFLDISPGVSFLVVFLVLSTSILGWKCHENNLFHSIFKWKWSLKLNGALSKWEKMMFGSSSAWSLKAEDKEDLFYPEKLVWSPSAIDCTKFTISSSWFLYK